MLILGVEKGEIFFQLPRTVRKVLNVPDVQGKDGSKGDEEEGFQYGTYVVGKVVPSTDGISLTESIDTAVPGKRLHQCHRRLRNDSSPQLTSAHFSAVSSSAKQASRLLAVWQVAR